MQAPGTRPRPPRRRRCRLATIGWLVGNEVPPLNRAVLLFVVRGPHESAPGGYEAWLTDRWAGSSAAPRVCALPAAPQLQFLRVVASHHDVNKMTAANLAVVFAPNLLWNAAADDGSHNMEEAAGDNPAMTKLLGLMIEDYELMFAKVPAPALYAPSAPRRALGVTARWLTRMPHRRAHTRTRTGPRSGRSPRRPWRTRTPPSGSAHGAPSLRPSTAARSTRRPSCSPKWRLSSATASTTTATRGSCTRWR